MADSVVADRYVLGAVLGRGGMGEVRKARDERLARDVALKILDRQSRERPEVLERFEYEAQASAALAHPNVVRVYDFGDDGNCVYLVMEALSGRTLADAIAEGRIEPARLVEIACDVLAGLGAAHDLGIVHRDIKPANVLFDERDRAKIADFGVATSGTLDLTQTGFVLGTPAYLAPERLAGSKATPRSDLYAVGVVCYEALSGAKPFTGDSALAVARAIERGNPLHLRERCPDLPAELCDAVMRAMQRDPEHRLANAPEFATALRAALPARRDATGGGPTHAVDRSAPATEAIPRTEDRTQAMLAVQRGAPAPVAPRPAAPQPAPRPARAGNRRVVVLVLAVMLFLAAGAGVLVWRDRNQGSSGGNPPANQAPLPTGAVRDAFDRLQQLVEP